MAAALSEIGTPPLDLRGAIDNYIDLLTSTMLSVVPDLVKKTRHGKLIAALPKLVLDQYHQAMESPTTT